MKHHCHLTAHASRLDVSIAAIIAVARLVAKKFGDGNRYIQPYEMLVQKTGFEQAFRGQL
jgi:hypothetical protein